MNYKRYVLPSLLILALAGSIAVAQTFTKALQLSQDTSGAFGVDSSNNLYLPSKLMFPTGGVSGAAAPTVAGTGTPTVSGTNAAGTITMGASATAATLTFGTAYGATPNCVVVTQSAMITTPISYTTTTTRIAIAQTATSGNLINYFCTGTTS